jgi:hypothetical protein
MGKASNNSAVRGTRGKLDKIEMLNRRYGNGSVKRLPTERLTRRLTK